MLNQNLLLAGDDGGYNIQRSLRLRSSASAYLNRTFTTSTNNKIWTFSAWCKVSSVSNSIALLGTVDNNLSSGDFAVARFSGGQFQFIDYASGYRFQFYTSALYRDPSAWYHVVIAVDTTQATSTNRVKIYINGSQITAFAVATYPSQNINTFINSAAATYLGSYYTSGVGPSNPFEGYLAEVRFIDGQQLTPSSFGETSTSTGVWIPKKYTGTYGTNGFYLPFTDVATTSGSNAGLGKDFSGNGNYWTTNNISVTSGSTYDSMKDVPTLTDTDTANYAVWNQINRLPTSATYTATFSNGNLQLTSSAGEGSGNSSAVGTMQIPSTGKWYWEVTITNRATLAASRSQIGIVKGSAIYTDPGDVAYNTTSNACYVYAGSGDKAVSYGIFSAYGSAWTNGDVIGVACDWDAGTLTFYKNGTSQGTAFSGLSGSDNYFPIAGYFGTFNINFGQRPFAYPLTGFKALNTFNLPTPTIGATASTVANKYFDATLYTGNSTTNNIVNAGSMQPDFVWIKSRSNNQGNNLFDSIRGAGYVLFSNLTNAETNNTANFTSFNSNGFSLASNGGDTNFSGYTYVAWQWRASNTTAVTNTAGSITSTVSANTTAGFSIVTYTGNGSGGATVGHGLGVAPKMVIVKRRDSGVGATNWYVYNANLNNGVNPAQYYIFLNLTNAQGGASSVWNDTAPTSSVFSLGTSSETNGSGGTFVAYCFAQVAGYSAFGKYTGNGSSDGPFVFLGFKPKFILIRRSDGIAGWKIYNTSGLNYNPINTSLEPHDSGAEATSTNFNMDLLSNGFKLKTTYADFNTNGGTYIYMAFAESPFKYSLAR